MKNAIVRELKHELERLNDEREDILLDIEVCYSDIQVIENELEELKGEANDANNEVEEFEIEEEKLLKKIKLLEEVLEEVVGITNDEFEAIADDEIAHWTKIHTDKASKSKFTITIIKE